MNKPTSNQSTAVEPAQRCNCCGYLVTDSEHKGCLRAAKQEQAQKCHKCGHDWHADSCVNVAPKQEPAQAEPLEGEPDSFNALQRDVNRYRFFRDQNLWMHVSGGDIWDAIAEADPIELDAIIDSMMNLAGNANAQPVAPPAIEDETRKMVLELCKLIIDNAGPDSMITRHMAQVAEKICNNLEAGNGE